MVDSIGTATLAFAGLQKLDLTNPALQGRARLTAGLRLDVARDGTPAVKIVPVLQSEIGQIRATQEAVAFGESIIDVAINATRRVENAPIELRLSPAGRARRMTRLSSRKTSCRSSTTFSGIWGLRPAPATIWPSNSATSWGPSRTLSTAPKSMASICLRPALRTSRS